MSTSPFPPVGVSAWFQLADSNQFIFKNTLCNDVIIRSTLGSQTIHIAPAPDPTNTQTVYSTMRVSGSSVSIVGDILTSSGRIISDASSIDVNGVVLSNQTLMASNVVSKFGASIGGPLNAASINVAGINIVDDNGAFATSNIPDMSLTNSKIAELTIESSKFFPGAVNTNALADRSVTSRKLAFGSVTSDVLSNMSLTSAKFFPGSVNSCAIGADVITKDHFSPGAVDTNALMSGAVTSEKLSSNLTVKGITRTFGTFSVNVDEPKNDVAVEISGPICLSSNNGNVTIYSSCNAIGINTTNPTYTLDVTGDINFTGSLYSGGANGTRYLPTQWINLPGCNIAFTNGFCGIGTCNMRSHLHVNGSVTVASNLSFDNPYKNDAIVLSTYLANMGINQAVPLSTLDVGGSIGIRNKEVIDGERNIKNIIAAQVETLSVSNPFPSSNYKVDVLGDVKLDASRFVMNERSMRISSKEQVLENGYYKIVDLKSEDDVSNYGSVVINGDVGNMSFDSSGLVTIVIGTRNTLSTGTPFQSVTKVMGGDPSNITSFIDLVLYQNPATATSSIYIWAREGSYFNLDVQGGPVIAVMYPDWASQKRSTPEGTYVKSFLTDQTGTVCSYSGAYKFGSNVKIDGDLFVSRGIFEKGRYTDTVGTHLSNVTLDIERTDSSTIITTNAVYNTTDSEWVNEKGDKTVLQLLMQATDDGDDGETGFFFNMDPNAPGIDGAPVTLSNSMAITSKGVGIGTMYPHGRLHVNGSIFVGDGEGSNVLEMKTSACNDSFTIGFSNNMTLSVTSENKVTINKNIPCQTLDVGGGVNVDGVLTFANATSSSHRVFNLSSTFVYQSSSSSRWIKVARFTPSILEPYCRCAVLVWGILANGVDSMNFEATINIDASSQDLCNVQVKNTISSTNFLKSVFDIVCYVDLARNVHVYAKCSATYLVTNLEFAFVQTVGVGISTYTDTVFPSLPFSDIERGIVDVDNTIGGPIMFVVSMQSVATEFITYTKTGKYGFGTDNPISKVHVIGTTTTNTLSLSDGYITTPVNKTFTVNGTPFVTSEGTFITSNIPDASIMIDKLAPVTVSNIVGKFTVSNFYPYEHGIGLFNSNPYFEVDIIGRVGITSKLNDGKVILMSSNSNGLGVNKAPKFTLDVAGDLNYDGLLRNKGDVLKTSQWTSDISSNIFFGSNVAIGPGISAPQDTALSVFTAMTLSNQTSLSRLATMSNCLGINLTSPNATLDVNGSIGISNTTVIDASRNIININNVNAARVGVNTSNVNFELDVVGDINMTGRLLKEGIVYISSQWAGSNYGITYDSNVAIGHGITLPLNETLCVFQNIGLSNDRMKTVLSLSGSNVLSCDTMLSAPAYTFSNVTGGLSMYMLSNNIGIGTQAPKSALDVNGTIGTSGTPFAYPDADGIVLSNVNTIFTRHMSLTSTRMGLGGVRDPKDTLTLMGGIGISNFETYTRISSSSNYVTVSAMGIMSSNAIITGWSPSNVPALFVGSSASNTQGDLVRIHANLPTMTLGTVTPSNAAYIAFADSVSNVVARIGLDGKGFTSATNAGVLTAWTSNNDLRIATRGLTRMRILAAGNTGFGTDAPAYTVDIGGTGLGVAGTKVLDVERNLFVKSGNFTSVLTAKRLSPGMTTNIPASNIDLMLTSAFPSSIGVRSTAITSSPSYVSYSNMVFGNPGRVVLLYNSNMYFAAADPSTGNTAYMNYAYQPVVPGSDIPNIATVNFDAVVLGQSKVLNFAGNAKIAASSWEMVNPEGTSTSFKIRHWDNKNIYNPASLTNSNYVEMKLDSSVGAGKMNTDQSLHFCVNDVAKAKVTGTGVWVSAFKVETLVSTGTKPVYADAMGNLTQSVSDARAKEDVETLSKGLETIEKLRPVSFKWREPYSATRGIGSELGLIAQEVREHVPECVGENNDGMMYVDYSKLVPVLIKAVQELKKDNDVLRSKIDSWIAQGVSHDVK